MLIDDVAIAAATQTGDQGMNIGRSATFLLDFQRLFLVTQLIAGAQER
jgi:hypothetical protein